MTAAANPRVAVAHQYARDVVSGAQVAGPLIRLACQRHLTDLEMGAARGLRFHEPAAAHTIDFIETFLRFPDGPAAGQPFILQPFQVFIVASLFGWQRWDTADRRWYRRFRTAYIELAKGSGKTPLIAAIGIYGLVADGVTGAQIYSAATQYEQASILLNDARRMVLASPDLLGVVSVLQHALVVEGSQSVMRALSRENHSLDGKRVNMALVDELHEHRDAQVVGKLAAGVKAAREPLIVEITNSGFDRESICWQHHAYSEAVLTGQATNDGWFALVGGLDEGDDWHDPAVWIKANPGLGTILPETYLAEMVQAATDRPAEQNLIIRLCFCIWTEQSTRWMDMTTWDACAGPVGWREMPARLRGQRCYAGLDLASTTDLAAFVLVFPDYSGDEVAYDVLVFAWCPEATVMSRTRKEYYPYDVWVRDGALIATPGNVISHKAILTTIQQVTTEYTLVDMGYDRWGSTKLTEDLEDMGFRSDPNHYFDRLMTPLGQGYATMSAPTKELEVIVKSGRLRHGGHPLLRWAVSNLVVTQDPAGNWKPDKDKSTEKIDPAVALIMAVQRAGTDDQGGNVYTTRGAARWWEEDWGGDGNTVSVGAE